VQSYTTRLEKSGRILIPAEVRRKLKLTEGSEVIVHVEDSGALAVESRDRIIDRIQERLQKYRPEGRLASEELLQERREEAAQENL
jgi:AbrB family looped-hinge helix DNA binding protein